MNDILKVKKDHDAWTLTLNNSVKRNALSAELVERLIDTLEQAHAEQVSLIVFHGAGKNFSAGFDFTDYEAQSEGDLFLRLVRIEQLLQLIARSSALTLAYAHGRNFGAGADLFCACKLRYCAAEASFRMPGLKFGLILGSRRFRDIVGPRRALSILSSTRTIGAAEAVEIGLAERLAAESEFDLLVDEAKKVSSNLDTDTRIHLYRSLDMSDIDANSDLAALVSSAGRPGLKNRIRDYLEGSSMRPMNSTSR